MHSGPVGVSLMEDSSGFVIAVVLHRLNRITAAARKLFNVSWEQLTMFRWALRSARISRAVACMRYL